MLDISINIALGILIISLILTLIRLLKGPGLQDRIISLDLIASVTAGLILLFMFISEEVRYIDIVIVLSLIVFLGTVAIAEFLIKDK
jgi:multisubunit Na+/H+ antiporter MnhF subunit